MQVLIQAPVRALAASRAHLNHKVAETNTEDTVHRVQISLNGTEEDHRVPHTSVNQEDATLGAVHENVDLAAAADLIKTLIILK